jgi:hypothetical protein
MKASSILLFFVALSLPAQDSFVEQSFGFGFDGGGSGGASDGSGGIAVSIGGEVSASMTGFVEDLSEGAAYTRLGDIASGRLNFSAETSGASGVINLKLAPGPLYYDEKSPVYVDEAYVRAWFGNFDVEGGLRKLTWGKADSMGPLDVVNPLNYSDLSELGGDMMDLKIARPLAHASLLLGWFSKPSVTGTMAAPPAVIVTFAYDPYHQIGLDWRAGYIPRSLLRKIYNI